MSRSRIARKGAAPPPRSPWPVVVLGLGALLIVVVGLLIWRSSHAPAQASPPPQVTGSAKLSVDRDVIDLGKVALGQTVQAQFKLKDVGDQPLQIVGNPRVELVKGC